MHGEVEEEKKEKVIKKSGSRGKISTLAAKTKNKFWGSPKPTNVYIYSIYFRYKI